MTETAMNKEMFDRGMQVRGEMYGADKANAELAATKPVNKHYHELVTGYCFGEVWGSTRMSRRDRSLVTIAQVAALGKATALAAHIETALHHGVTKEEVIEVVMNTALYCGIPTASEANRAAMDVFKAKGLV
jgi:4-carboxymuconolactone decarboxylase